jgi:ATP-dependent Clp protease ATP-binding subunit ClpA
LGQALADGVVRERGGGRIYLSDAIILMTAPVGVTTHRRIGLIADEEGPSDDLKEALDRALGVEFVDQIDLFLASAPATVEGKRKWVERALLDNLSQQYRSRRVDIEWNDSFIQWIVDQKQVYPTKAGLTRFVEDRLGEVVIPLLPAAGEERVALLVTVRKGRIEAASTDRSSQA